jgi:hypothetical protein
VNTIYIQIKVEIIAILWMGMSIETILEYIQKIIDLIKEHPGCKVTILEIPAYTIVSWNKHSGHKNSEKFTEQDPFE